MDLYTQINNNKNPKIQYYWNSGEINVSLENNIWKNIYTFNLPAGLYIAIINIRSRSKGISLEINSMQATDRAETDNYNKGVELIAVISGGIATPVVAYSDGKPEWTHLYIHILKLY